MNKLLNREQGASHLVAVLIVLVVAIVGVVALRVSNAYVWPKNRVKTNITRPTGGIYTNTGASATCTANGNPGTVVNGICRASSPGTPGVTNTTNTTTTSSGANGANGTTTCTVNGQTYTSTTGSCNATSTSNNGQSVCTVNGVTVPCQ